MSATTSETMLTAAEAKAMSEKANKGYYGDFTKLENILNVIKSKATVDGVTNVEIWYHSDSSEPSELITTLEDLGYEVSWSDCWSCLTIFWDNGSDSKSVGDAYVSASNRDCYNL